jgi:hypothetical protein
MGVGIACAAGIKGGKVASLRNGSAGGAVLTASEGWAGGPPLAWRWRTLDMTDFAGSADAAGAATGAAFAVRGES